MLQSHPIFEKKVVEFSPLLSTSEFSLRHLQILGVDCEESDGVQVKVKVICLLKWGVAALRRYTPRKQIWNLNFCVL